jgi:hypothetical protein
MLPINLYDIPEYQNKARIISLQDKIEKIGWGYGKGKSV